jgi:hypothetical protein
MLAMAAKGHAAMKSKLLPIVVLLLWFGAHGSSAQDGSLIIAIRAEVAQINGSLSACTKTTKIGRRHISRGYRGELLLSRQGAEENSRKNVW